MTMQANTETLTCQSILESLRFLPPNTTALTQPLDQGIIRAFKSRYIKLLLDAVIAEYEVTKTSKNICKNITLENAIRWCATACDTIPKSCLVNCWKKCGFFRNDGDMPVLLIDEDDCEDELSERLRVASSIFADSIGYEEYINRIELRYREIQQNIDDDNFRWIENIQPMDVD